MIEQNMTEQHRASTRRSASRGNNKPIPEFYMPAMPPIYLTEALDRWLKRWLRRRKFRRLLKFDDQHLAVLGLKRDDLQWAARQPMKTDAFEALQERIARCT